MTALDEIRQRKQALERKAYARFARHARRAFPYVTKPNPAYSIRRAHEEGFDAAWGVLSAALDAVLAVHKSVWSNEFAPDGYVCSECWVQIESEDCPTVQAITAHLQPGKENN